MRIRALVSFALAGTILTGGARSVAFAQSAQPPAPDQAAAPRPKLALVLSGGGARGAAHIGVLRVLEEIHVRPDMIIGTSMGSIVGGLYATGWSPDEIEEVLKNIDFKETFIDRPYRDDKSYRRKQEDQKILFPAKLRFRGFKPYFPQGLLGGQRLDMLLRSIEIDSTGETDFELFPIPYRAIGADIVTGETVVMSHGSLATAMRASMSIAGAFAPVEYEGHMLVDGGAVANLPIGIAQSLGAERVIAIDISTPLGGKEGLSSAMSIFSQMSGLLTVGNRVQDVARLRPGDVLIVPELGDISFSDFARAPETVAIGEKAARQQIEALRAFAVTPAEWEAFQDLHRRRRADTLEIDEVRLDNTSLVNDGVVQSRVNLSPGPWNAGALKESILRLSGLDYFGLIRSDYAKEADKQVLTLRTPPKPYSRNSLQFGVTFMDDFRGDNSYTLAMRHQFLAANRKGGEWENLVQIGERAFWSSEFYQPLDNAMQWFVAPRAEIVRQNIPLWQDGSQVAEYREKEYAGYLDTGRVLGDWGEVRLSAFGLRSNGEVQIGSPLFPPQSAREVGLEGKFRIDTLDSTIFPRRGVALEASWNQAFTSFGSDEGRRTARVSASAAWSLGRNAIVPTIEIQKSFDPPDNFLDQYFLGGLGRLSGLGRNELLGVQGGLARIVYYRELLRIDLGSLSQKVYAGASIESGNAYDAHDAVTWNSLNFGGSVFLGVDSLIGPVFLGVGLTDGGNNRLYLAIGERF